MYKAKKKRVRDPNLPPPPNLLSHDKTIRGINSTLEITQSISQYQQQQIDELKRKLNQALYRIDLLTTHLRNTRNNG